MAKGIRVVIPPQAEYLWMRGQHRVRHARAVMLFQAKSKYQRLQAILKAVGGK